MLAGSGAVLRAEQTLSENMQLGISYFEQGKDSRAMDRFIEVLNQGNPIERQEANQYLNRITLRMGEGAVDGPNEPSSTVPSTIATSTVPLKEGSALSRTQVEGKIKNMARAGLRALRALPEVVVVSGADGHLLTVAIPSNSLFRSKIAFRSQARKMIESLALTIYGEGKAKILIFPQGAALGDVKVMNMRRAVAAADALVASGIAPSRVQAELLTGRSYPIPRRFVDFKGIIFIFTYGKPPDLKAPPDEDGPPLSLGLSTPRFRVDKGEGSLIEFSVEEPPSGVRFWKFKILRDGNEKSGVMEEIVGNGPVFHQVYWDGRKNYSGPPQSSGSYECLLMAEDGAGRMRAIHRWIVLEDKAGAAGSHTKIPQTLLADVKAPTKKSLSAPVTPVEKYLHGGKRVTYVKLSKKNKKKSSPAAVIEFLFKPGTYQLMKASKKNIVSLARSMAKDKKARYDIIGYAKPTEKNAKNLCRLRAQVVAGLFINKYRISVKRLTVKSELSVLGKPRVTVKKRGSVKKWHKKI
jgi:outer membrane protein OmpA-like peptidoglycan-associated protein